MDKRAQIDAAVRDAGPSAADGAATVAATGSAKAPVTAHKASVEDGDQGIPLDDAAAGPTSAIPPVGFQVLRVLALVTIACAGLYTIADFFGPLFLALTLVLTVRPIHRRLVKYHVPGFISGTITILVLVIVLGAIAGLMAWSLAGLPETLMRYQEKFSDIVDEVTDFAQQWGFSTEEITNQLSAQFDAATIIAWIRSAAGSLMSAGTIIGILALCVLFLTVDTIRVNNRADVVQHRDSDFYRAICSFEGRVRQYWLVASIFGLVVSVINYFVLVFLHVPMPLTWALWTFITNYIPNVGFILGVIPPAIMGLVDSGWSTALWVIVIFTVINVTIQGMIQPKFTGDAVGLSTTITFVSLLFWTAVIGPLGSILAVPLTLFFKALLVDSSPSTRWIEAFLIPESDARRKREKGLYNPGTDLEVFHAFGESRSRLSETLGTRSQRSVSRLSRAKRRSSRK